MIKTDNELLLINRFKVTRRLLLDLYRAGLMLQTFVNA